MAAVSRTKSEVMFRERDVSAAFIRRYSTRDFFVFR